jgi:hypothetical protein
MKTLLIAAVSTLSLVSSIAPATAFDLFGPDRMTSGSGFDGTGGLTVIERRKPRVPGGSGCDTPRDQREHPECRS